MITEEIWKKNRYTCPCLLEGYCLAKERLRPMLARCTYDYCPFVFWLNKMNKE